MVYVEWFDYENEKWCLSKMNIFKAIYCVLFGKYLGYKIEIVPRKNIQFY